MSLEAMDISPVTQDTVLDRDFEQALRHRSHRSSPNRPQSVHYSHRISKLPSTGNSPKKTSARRSTLSSGYGPSPADVTSQAWQSSAAQNEGNVLLPSKSRPISWHPSSHLTVSTTSPIATTSYFPEGSAQPDSYTLRPFTTTQIHGLITPLSQPCYGEPMPHEVFSALDASQPYEDPYAFLDEFRADPQWSPSSPFTDVLGNNGHRSHPTDNYTSALQTLLNTAPPSPIPRPTESEAHVSPRKERTSLLLKINSATEDLVGMGLYDPPSPRGEPAMGGFYDLKSSFGMGLKLEETFEPLPPEEDEAEENEEDGQAGDAETEAEQERQAHGKDVMEETAHSWQHPSQASAVSWV